MVSDEQGEKPTRRWTNPKTVHEISESKNIDSEKFGEDLLNEGKAVEVYGQMFTDETDAAKFLKQKIREEKSNIFSTGKKPRLKLSAVGRKNAGVLDAQRARSDSYVPIIEKEIARITHRLDSSEIEGYERGRLERDRAELEARLVKHNTNRSICVDTLNKLYAPKSKQDTGGKSPETG